MLPESLLADIGGLSSLPLPPPQIQSVIIPQRHKSAGTETPVVLTESTTDMLPSPPLTLGALTSLASNTRCIWGPAAHNPLPVCPQKGRWGVSKETEGRRDRGAWREGKREDRDGRGGEGEGIARPEQTLRSRRMQRKSV